MLRLSTFVLSLFWAFCMPAFAQLFEIARPAFSEFVTEDGNYTPVGTATDGKISRASLSRGLLYFSFTVMGGEPALEYLRRNRLLEVEVVILGDRSQRIRDLGISQEKWSAKKDAWISQLDGLGFFTFRTFMNTQRISGDVIELQIRDAKNNIIRPVASNSLTYKASVTIVP